MTYIVGIAGRKGHGKDTAAKKLIEEDGFEVVKMAGALKEMVRAYLRYVGVETDVIERMIEGDLKEVASPFFSGKTPRFVMQTLGSEWGRDTIGQFFWTDAFIMRANLFDKVVCTDLRFQNEVDVVKDGYGLTIRVTRPGAPKSEDTHQSETAIDGLITDHVIINDGTVDTLQAKVRALAARHLDANGEAL